MNNEQLEYISGELEDIRQRIDSIYNYLSQSENDIRKRLEANYKALWQLINKIEVLKDEKK